MEAGRGRSISPNIAIVGTSLYTRWSRQVAIGALAELLAPFVGKVCLDGHKGLRTALGVRRSSAIHAMLDVVGPPVGESCFLVATDVLSGFLGVLRHGSLPPDALKVHLQK